MLAKRVFTSKLPSGEIQHCLMLPLVLRLTRVDRRVDERRGCNFVALLRLRALEAIVLRLTYKRNKRAMATQAKTLGAWILWWVNQLKIAVKSKVLGKLVGMDIINGWG